MFTIGRLAKQYGLSRSTLLYYDSIGLFKPTSRGNGEYRLYSRADAERLEQIRTYRKAGLKLKDIKLILDAPDNDLTAILENRLEELNREIEALREQQRRIVGILKNSHLFKSVGFMNKETWVSILAASGFSESDMAEWHAAFERSDPEKHKEFLRFLCIPDEDIEQIRDPARTGREESAKQTDEKEKRPSL